MPLIKSAVKRARQTIKRRERNVAIKKDVKSAYKAFVEKPTATTLSAAQSEIDTALKKNLIKKNTASRRKANLHKIAKAAGIKLVAAKKPTVKKSAPVKKPVVKKAAAKKPAAKKTVKK